MTLCRAFADALFKYTLAFTHLTHPYHPTKFVDGVLRVIYSVPCVDFARIIGTPFYTYCYNTVYKGCTTGVHPKEPFERRRNLSESYHYALRAVLTHKLKDGTIPWTPGGECEAPIRFLMNIFKYLDRFYVKRLSLPPLTKHVQEAYTAGEPVPRSVV